MIAKWQEPAPAKQTRVLPVPDMEPKKRRGGRRSASHCASLCSPCGLVQVDSAAHTCLWVKGGEGGQQSACAQQLQHNAPHRESRVRGAGAAASHLGAGRCT